MWLSRDRIPAILFQWRKVKSDSTNVGLVFFVVTDALGKAYKLFETFLILLRRPLANFHWSLAFASHKCKRGVKIKMPGFDIRSFRKSPELVWFLTWLWLYDRYSREYCGLKHISLWILNFVFVRYIKTNNLKRPPFTTKVRTPSLVKLKWLRYWWDTKKRPLFLS